MLIVALIILAVALYSWLMRPRLRRLPRWDAAVAKVRALFERACVRLRGLCGNSKTIAVAYAAELLGVLDEAKVLSASRRRQRRPRHGDHGRGDDPAAPRHPHRGRLQAKALIKSFRSGFVGAPRCPGPRARSMACCPKPEALACSMTSLMWASRSVRPFGTAMPTRLAP